MTIASLTAEWAWLLTPIGYVTRNGRATATKAGKAWNVTIDSTYIYEIKSRKAGLGHADAILLTHLNKVPTK